MTARLDHARVAPEAMRPLLNLEKYLTSTSLPYGLRGLIKLRVSQINGCAYCVNMHSRELREHGETQQRIDLVVVWRETELYDERERAALAWAEAVTRLADGGIPDELYEATRAHFDEKELVDLTMAVVAINGWNRLAVPFKKELDDARPTHAAKPALEEATS